MLIITSLIFNLDVAGNLNTRYVNSRNFINKLSFYYNTNNKIKLSRAQEGKY